jgi:hypothetical protein
MKIPTTIKIIILNNFLLTYLELNQLVTKERYINPRISEFLINSLYTGIRIGAKPPTGFNTCGT